MLKFLLVVFLVALAIYLLMRVIERRGVKGMPQRPGPRPPRRPVAPDDDPDFLRDLERKKRKRQRDEPDST